MNNEQNFQTGAPLFANSFNNTTPEENNSAKETTAPSFVSPSNPPELGVITNLDDATKVQGPTLDVLGPMNTFDVTQPSNKDELDAYDNGLLQQQSQDTNIADSNNTTGDVINNSISTEQNIQPAQSFNNNASISSNEFQTFQQPWQIASQTNTSEINNEEQTSQYLEPQIPPESAIENEEKPPVEESNYDIINNSFENKPEDLLSSNIEPQKEEKTENNPDNYDILNNDLSESVSEDHIEDKTYDVDNRSLSESTDQKVDNFGLKDDFDLVEEQEDETSNPEEYLENLSEDSIETKDDVEELDSDSKENEEPKELVSNDVEKIKSTIKELQDKGTKIELEEFDFEDMYQLIIKINK